MIYLDYAANTPAHEEVLKSFVDFSTQYIANPNASHALGKETKIVLDEATERIAKLLGVQKSEIIYTSGATESNNLALKGIAYQYRRKGNTFKRKVVGFCCARCINNFTFLNA